MEPELAPVALFVYNRPHHTLETIKALAANRLASQTDLIIFSDGYKNDLDQSGVELTRRVISNIQGFKSVTLNLANRNKGLANSIIEGVTEVLKTNKFIIVLEDDLLTSPGFLEFMNQGLSFYNHTDIYSVSGYTPNIQIDSKYKYSTYYTGRICSWGWATWADKWKNIDWELLQFDKFFSSNIQTQRFNEGGNDLSIMLLKCKLGIIKSWAVRFAYHTYNHGGGAIYPTSSLVKNMGADGSGTNMKASQKYEVDLADHLHSSSFCPPSYRDEKIILSFRHFYNTSLIRWLINLIKRTIYRLSIAFRINKA